MYVLLITEEIDTYSIVVVDGSIVEVLEVVEELFTVVDTEVEVVASTLGLELKKPNPITIIIAATIIAIGIAHCAMFICRK